MDTLNMAVQGTMRESVYELLSEVQERAKVNEAPEVFTFPTSGRRMECRAYGRSGYTYWLSCLDFELIVGRFSTTKFRPVLVQIHSAFLHSVGVDQAVDDVERVCRLDLFSGEFESGVSRIDLHADFQGMELRTADLDRFCGYGRARKAFLDYHQVFQSGSALAGFQFGRDAIVCRVYDKTRQIAEHPGGEWWPDVWAAAGDAFDPDATTWRVEFQFRREGLADFHIRTVDQVLASVQDLWKYAGGWLSLRVPSRDLRRRRWPLDPQWKVVQAVTIAPTMTGVVRRRLELATEHRLIQGIQGYATSLGALRGHRGRQEAMTDIGALVDDYLSSRGLQFAGEVDRKRARRLEVTES